MGRTFEAIGMWHWNLADPTEGYTSGVWQHDDHSLAMSSGQYRELTVSLAGFQPLTDDARAAAAWIGITQASFSDDTGSHQISADLNNPLSWPRILSGVFVSFRVSMVVFHAQAGFDYAVRTYSE